MASHLESLLKCLWKDYCAGNRFSQDLFVLQNIYFSLICHLHNVKKMLYLQMGNLQTKDTSLYYCATEVHEERPV